MIGSATLSCANTDGVYISQSDPRWGSTSRGGAACSIASSGCGSASTAMILNAFGANTTVVDVWNTQHNTGGYAYDGGSCASWFWSALNTLKGAGLSTIAIRTSWNEADQVLKNCGLILALGTAHRPRGPVKHFIVITGLNWDTNHRAVISYNTLDPAYPLSTQDGKTFTIDEMWGVVK